MAADLDLKISLDTSGFDRGITSAEKGLADLEGTTKRISNQKLNITPTGGRELDAAASSADRLGNELDAAASSAQKIKPNPSVPSSLDQSSRAASQLAVEVNKAGAGFDRLGASGSQLGGVEARVSGLASTVRGMLPALSAGAAATATFTKGWGRLTSIDDAQFKLQGLGHTATSTADIMDAAMTSVKGTAYGFGDAASLAAGVVAATGAEGERLAQILGTVADTAAISGRSLGDMGMIFNQVAASGTLMGDDLNQLMDSGIPVLNMLADEMGVAASEVKDLASDGAISFEIFESAMRKSMGGAAKEMGQSVTGALANVSAALGRLGAEAMSGGFGALPGVLSGVTSGIDTLTSSVTTLSGWFDKVPGPIKAMAAALLTAKAGTTALNSELGQKLVGHLKSAGSGALGLGKNVTQAFRDMGTAYQTSAAPLLQISANHRTAADAARVNALESTDAFSTIDYMGQQAAHGVGASTTQMAGHLKGIGGAAKSGATSVVNALGGPLNLALAGTGLAIGALVQANNKATNAQEIMAGSAHASAEAQRDLYDALAGTTGALDDQALAAAAQVVKSELTEIVDIGSQYQGMLNVIEAPDLSWWQQGRWSSEWREYSAGIDQTAEQYALLEDAAAKTGISVDEVNDVVADGGARYDNLIAALRETGAAGEVMADKLEGARDEISSIVGASRRADESFMEISEGMRALADNAGDATSQIEGLRSALQAAGLIPASETEAAVRLAESLQEIKDIAAEGINEDISTGWSLIGEDGLLNVKNNENARLLHGHMSGLADGFWNAAEAGIDAQETWDDMQPTMQALADSFGIPIEEVQRLANSYGVLPEEANTYISIQGAGEVAGELAAIHLDLAEAEEGATVNVGIISGDTADVLDDFGYKVKELDDGTYEITVGSNAEESSAEIEGLLELYGRLGGTTVSPSVLLDTSILHNSAANAIAILDELDVTNPSPEAELIIERLLSGKNISMQELGILSSYTADPSATLNDAEFLGTLGLSRQQLSLFDNESASAVLKADDQASSTISKVRGMLANWPKVVSTVISTVTGNSAGGVAGGLPGLADGGFTGAMYGNPSGGYRLPMGGPGTETTDGILGMGRNGVPTAWVDRGEYVTNRDSTSEYLGALEAINRGSPTAAIVALLRSLPALNEGGVLGATTRTMPAPTPSTEGGGAGVADTATSVLDHAALLGGMIEDIPEESEVTITLTAEGVADELSLIGQQLEPLGEGETITVDAIGEQAMSVLNAVGVETNALPDGSVEVTAASGQALDELANVSQMLFEVGDTIVDPEVLLDTRELEVSAEDAQTILNALDIENPTPYASIIIDDLLNGKGIAQGELEFLASMVPTPAADLNTALLQAGVQVSESELQRVGAQKATSVVDVNNQSALTNVQATLDALNRMPVERTIRIVAAGSAASAIGQFNTGGRIPALASGGRLPTTGPGTDTVDGILGVGGDGVPTAMVDAGEWVITRNRSQRFDRTLGAINAGNQRDIYEALKADMPGMQHLNKGGVVSPEQLLNFAAGQNVGGQQARQSLQGAPYVWGGVNWGDCSGAMAGLANFATGLNAFGSRFATMNQREATAALGFKPGLGDPSTSFNLGWFNGGPWGGHTAGDVGGTAVEMGGGAGGQGKIGGAAASASSGQFTDHAHLTLGELWAFDRFESLPALTQRYQPAPDPSWQTEGGDGLSPGGLGLQLVNGFGGGVSHTGGDGVHLNNGMVIPYQKGRLYDTGGDWEKGTWGFNNIGTEHVLTPERRVDYLDAGQNIPEATRAMTRVADAVDNLHPQVRRMVDEVAPQLVGMASQTDKALNHLSAISDYQSKEGVQARATAGRVLDMDILPYSSELQGILDAETKLWDARAAQEDRARAITTAETGLSEAREELARLQKEDPGMSVQDQRKLADAEKAVGKARADGDAGKVADAEQKLARAREDVEANSSKNAVKRQEDIAKATDSVASAEQDLTQARRESVEALDASLYSVLPQLNQGLAAASGQIGGFASQLGAMGGIAAGAAPMLGGVSAQLASMAAFAGPAGISIGMALTIVDTVLSVARKIGAILGDLAKAASAGRAAAAKAHAESVSAIREWTSVVDEQRQTVSRLKQSVVRAGLDIMSAQWEVRTAQLDVGRAQLEGVRSVAQAEAALAEERERQARADWWQYNDLTLAYDRLRWAQQDVAYGQLEDYATVTPEILALQHEVLAAQLISAGSVHSAQLASLQASFGLMEAQKLLARGQRDLNHAMAEYNRMSGTSFGMTTPEAMVAEEIARLQAENAKLAGENPQASGLLGGLDFDGDGKIFFGLIDLVGKERTALQSAIDANNRAIENLLNSGHAPDWDEATWAEAMKVIDQAADMYRRGNDASADALIAGSIWGDAQRALNETKLLNEIAQWEQAQRELEDDISDLQDMVEFEEMAQPLRELIAALEAGANSAQYSADALREQNPAIRAALEALAEFEGGAARDIRDGQPPQQITIIGNNFSAEQIQELLDQLAGHGSELEVRVEALEQPDRPTAHDVMASRR